MYIYIFFFFTKILLYISYYLDQPIPKDVKQKLSYIFKFRELMKASTN